MDLIRMIFDDVRAFARWFLNLYTAVIIVLAMSSGLLYGNVHELLTERVPAITLLPFVTLGSCYVLIGTAERTTTNKLFAFKKVVLFQGVFAGAAMVGMLLPMWAQVLATYLFIGLCLNFSWYRRYQVKERLLD